jgi:hypothetical protein
MVLHRTLIRAPDSSKNSKYGAAGAQDCETVSIFKYISAKTVFA